MPKTSHLLTEPDIKISAIIVGATAFFLFVAVAGAFNEPALAPPGANVSPPINTSTSAQTKQGVFSLNATFVVPEICLSGSCRSIWPKEGRWDISGSSIYYNNGNVGIGTAGPGQKLSVAGVVESTSGGFKFPDGSTQTSAVPASIPGECKVYNTSSCPTGKTDLGSIPLGSSYSLGRFQWRWNYNYFLYQTDCLAVLSCIDKGWNPVVTRQDYYQEGSAIGYSTTNRCGSLVGDYSPTSVYWRDYSCQPPTVKICC